jgi:hypothetical protein
MLIRRLTLTNAAHGNTNGWIGWRRFATVLGLRESWALIAGTPAVQPITKRDTHTYDSAQPLTNYRQKDSTQKKYKILRCLVLVEAHI